MYAAAKIAEAEAEGNAAAIKYWAGIRDLVDEAPPLSSEQRAVLTVLLRPASAAELPSPIRTAA